MNGAQALLRTLVDSGVDMCFANPGTSEMHFVAALDDVPEMRGVLGLFEGVVTGAADGYARMAGRPAVTLLHLGPGPGNGLANLHNARRARTPIVNVVGDHALHHKALDAPLESDIDAVAWSVSGWVRRSESAAAVATDAAEAVAAARSGAGVATLILPADVSWSEGGLPAPAVEPTPPAAVEGSAIEEASRILAAAGPAGAVLVGAPVLQPRGTGALERVCRVSGARALYETFPARMTRRGGGRFEPRRLAYPIELATKQLADVEHLVLIGAIEPVAFFGYPGKPGRLAPEGCTVHTLAEPGADGPCALDELASIMSGDIEPAGEGDAPVLERPSGPIDASSAAAAVAATLPEGAIVSDEGTTCGMYMLGATRHGPQHDWLNITGGAIGQGMPVATGAALACGDRPVLNIQSDGSAMYTIQALWTQAREQLDVTTLLCNNGAYAILAMELDQVGAVGGGEVSRSLLDLGRPDLDFCRLAEGQGVPAVRVATAEDLCDQLEHAYREPGPHLIEAMFRT
ncbi:MAG: acetolactate synthase large subunit [Acidimicrobiaceae bacterium]|nr:acetolactate synthase large subunit [Acidimicrobiaceae bacterium]